jgi:protein YibB
MSEISIVTAFYDIGRSGWTTDIGLPHYLHRTTDTYFERFSYLASLDNEMVVFTSEDLVDRVKKIRGDKPTQVIAVDFKDQFLDLKRQVTQIQISDKFINMINPYQIKNPEYWSCDYVVVNMLKSVFVNLAIKMNLINNDLVAWMDFGYCRDESILNGVKTWKYNFNKDKIHFFNIKDYKEGTYISEIIANNDVHITGPCIVASKELWPKLEKLVDHSLKELLNNELIDDDQTVLLMSYLLQPELFELHKVSDTDWFVAFKEYSE